MFFFSTVNVSAKSFQIDEIEISEPFKEKFDKNLVIDKGFRNAFFKLINLLVKSNDFDKVKSIRLNEIKSMIDSFTIQEEKFIDETYYLKIGVNFDKRKIVESVNSCKFSNLSKAEDMYGFEESSNSKFFRKGVKDSWKNELNSGLRKKLEVNFKDEMIELGYL